MMRLLRSLESMSRSEWRVLAIALPLVAAVRVALWLLPSRIIVRLTRHLAAGPERATAARLPLGRIVQAVVRAARLVPQASCLTQAVAAQLLLHRYGYGSTLCLGVATDIGGAFRAHAWVEHGGRIVIGGEGSRRLVRLDLKPGAAAGVHT